MERLLLLPEVVTLSRHTIRHAYNLLQRGTFPIAHVPGVKPYRFTEANVRAFVVEGRATNPNLDVKRGRFFRRKVA